MSEWLLSMVPAWEMNAFRALLALCILFKFVVEWTRGYDRYLTPGHYLYFVRNLDFQHHGLWLNVYRQLYWAKWFGAAGLLIGGPLRFLGPVLALSLFAELRVYFKYHANLMFLLIVLILCLPSAAWIPIWNPAGMGQATLPRICYLAGCLTISAVYFFTAVHKMNPRFLSGEVVIKTIELVQQYPRNHFDNFLRSITPHILKCKRGVAVAMWATVALELALPVLLLYRPTFFVGVACGMAMHFAFAMLFPATLIHFSVMMSSAYLLFAAI